MKMLAFILNIPWTIIGILCAVISVPTNISFSQKPFAVVFSVRSFWWYTWLPGKSGVRAAAIGNTVLLGKKILQNDIQHELVHVEQAMRAPLIFPILYFVESWKKGYVGNKYEVEAYGTTDSVYIEEEIKK